MLVAHNHPHEAVCVWSCPAHTSRSVPRYEDQPGNVSDGPFSPVGFKDRFGMPTGREERKAIPMATGLLDYFPLALASVAALSKVGNDQHNPGQPLHWARSKSTDEADCILRHMVDRGTVDNDGVRHSTKVAWRALAMLQKEIEQAEALPLSRGSKP